jgi:CRISPR system Cascade subunit CasB
MSSTQASKQPPDFIRHLFNLCDREDRGALSELRRSLVSENDILALRHVLPWFRGEVSSRRQSAAVLLAGLFALHHSLHPERTTGPNFGHSIGRVWREQDRRPSTEQRFVTLLNAHSEDLPYYLRQAVSLVGSHEIPVDWAQLYSDLCYWNHTGRSVQLKWARAFWGAPEEEENQHAVLED